MNTKGFLSFSITAFLLSGYPVPEVFQANSSFVLAESIWKPFSSSEGRFRVLMPGTPVQEKGSVNTKHGSITINSLYVVRDEAEYEVVFFDFPKSISLNSMDFSSRFDLLINLQRHKTFQFNLSILIYNEPFAIKTGLKLLM